MMTSSIIDLAEFVTRDPIQRMVPGSYNLQKSLCDFIESALVSSTILDKIVASSYDHPLGFTKITLWQTADKRKLRLHCWPNKTSTTDIHDHFRTFRGVILDGNLQVIDYTVRDGHEYDCLSVNRHPAGAFDIERNATANLDVICRRELGKDEQYSLEAGRPHASSALEKSATLVFQGREGTEHNYIYRKNDGIIEFTPKPSKPADIVKLLIELARGLRQ